MGSQKKDFQPSNTGSETRGTAATAWGGSTVNTGSRQEAVATSATREQSSVFVTLTPIMVVVLVAYLIIGLAMPVLPLYVHQALGFSTFVVGLATGCQFAAALVSRFWSGHYADTKGAKDAVIVGLILGASTGILYLLSLHYSSTPKLAITLLLLGRLLLGGAESFVITGALAWGLELGGSKNTGKVIAWIGTALWAAYAAGAPAGSALYSRDGFMAISLSTLILPLLALLLVMRLRPIKPKPGAKSSVMHVIKIVWLPGLGLALTAIGYGTITTFCSLLFAERGWNLAWLAFTALGVAFISGRVMFGHLPDRIGGARVSLVCVVVEAAGLLMIWLATSPVMVFVGSAVTGLGYSLVYPGFGIEAVHLTPPESCGLAMGVYTAFLDLSLGLANPALGLLAGAAGLNMVFLVSTLLVIGAAGVALRLLFAAPVPR